MQFTSLIRDRNCGVVSITSHFNNLYIYLMYPWAHNPQSSEVSDFHSSETPNPWLFVYMSVSVSDFMLSAYLSFESVV